MKRIIALLGCVAVVAAVPAASLAASARTAAAPTKTIVQIAAGDPAFSTLVSLLKEAGLVGVLSGKTDYTVFAPTNAAFAKVPAATLKALAANKAMLKSVLLYHVVAGSVPASKVVTLHSVKTVEGAIAHDHRLRRLGLRQQGQGHPDQHPCDQRDHSRDQRRAHSPEHVALAPTPHPLATRRSTLPAADRVA